MSMAERPQFGKFNEGEPTGVYRVQSLGREMELRVVPFLPVTSIHEGAASLADHVIASYKQNAGDINQGSEVYAMLQITNADRYRVSPSMINYSIIRVPVGNRVEYFHLRVVEGLGERYPNAGANLDQVNRKKVVNRLRDITRLEHRGDIKLRGFHLGTERSL